MIPEIDWLREKTDRLTGGGLMIPPVRKNSLKSKDLFDKIEDPLTLYPFRMRGGHYNELGYKLIAGINISAKQFDQDKIVDVIKNAIDDTKVESRHSFR